MMRCLTYVICGFLLASSAPAQGKGKGKGHGRGETQAAVQVSVFRGGDRRLIIDYFQDARSGLPPGLAKRDGGLPPGLEKQLRRNGRLPPGLEKRLQLFPAELEARLPPLPSGYRRGMIGGRAVLFNPGRSLVLDVFVVW